MQKKPTPTATNAEQFYEKYSKKRITSSFVVKYGFYNYLYWAYLTNDQKPIDYWRDRIVSDETRVYSRHWDDKEIFLSSSYNVLCAWTSGAFESAILVRNSLHEYIGRFYDIAASAIAAENIRKKLGDKAEDEDIAPWLSTLTLDHYRPTDEHFTKITRGRYSIRANIENYLRYLNVYNTLISIIADKTDTPEYIIFQVDMTAIKAGIAQLNEALEMVRDDISSRPIKLEPVTLKAGDTVSMFPPLHLAEKIMLMEAFAPVSDTAPDIPEANIKNATREIDDGLSFRTSNHSYWRYAFEDLCRDYWER